MTWSFYQSTRPLTEVSVGDLSMQVRTLDGRHPYIGIISSEHNLQSCCSVILSARYSLLGDTADILLGITMHFLQAVQSNSSQEWTSHFLVYPFPHYNMADII